jgi:ring-1,2-phenylacetyl-CoA epoxidase subunit PaaD
VSEAGTQLSIARARAGFLGPKEPVLAAVRWRLASLPDPELPVVSIADLGMIHDVSIDGDAIRIAILPTFVGCPALDVIVATIQDGLADLGRPVEVVTTFAVPWTSDRITPAGRAALAAAGIAPPADPEAMRCPLCRSAEIVIDSAFGPTQCRSLYYCRACRQPFEAMKSV